MAAEDYIDLMDWSWFYDDEDPPEPRIIPFDKIEAETPKAWLIKVDGVDHWFPKSQCTLTQAIVVPEWLAQRKEIR